MEHPATPGPYRALIERDLRARVDAARGSQAATVEGPLGLRCRTCGDVNPYRAVACRRCATLFNAEIVWLPSADITPQEPR